MSTLKVTQEIREIAGHHRVPFEYSYGRQYPRFYRELRDNRRLMSVKCSNCGQVVLPPRPYCGHCFADASEWVGLPETGSIRTFTVVYQPFLGQPKKPPYCYVVVVPDGTNAEVHHLLEEVDYSNVHVGMRVEIVWNEHRKGTIWDIKYYKPTGG